MRDLEREARRYLTPPGGAFWRWADEGTVVVLSNGGTVAFDAELLAVLRRLAPNGLPPMSSLVLLLAATRGMWHSQDSIAAAYVSSEYDADFVDRASRLMAGLDRVALLEPDLLALLSTKVALAEIVFENVRRKTGALVAQAVVDLLENGVGEGISTAGDADEEITVELFNFHECFRMTPGLECVTAERLKLRMGTGLDELVEPADLDEPLPERVRALLAQLTRDERHAGLAGLARNLMAAVTLPRPVSDPDEMPLGGVSDIANRGPLDRLLLSELAHDDLTLAVRVAVGEALYLRRESPPKTPPRQRTLLLDAGLRMWGLPRVFATAAALALAATSDPRAEFAIHRAHGKSVEPVDLSTRAGLVEHLAALSTELHPGEALEAFARELSPDSAEPLIITTEEALDDPEFVSELRRQALAPLFLATVSRTGEFSLYQDTGRGKKLLRQAQLDLEQLLRTPKPRVLDHRQAKNLPAIFSVEPFPLLLPHHLDSEHAWEVENHGMLALTNDCRLLHFAAKGRGGRQLSDRMPRGKLHWFAPRAVNLNAYAVVGNLQTARLQLLEILLDRGQCELMPLELPQPTTPVTGFCEHHGALMAIRPKQVEVLEMATGRHLQTVALPPGVRWLRGRLFSGDWGRTYLALACDGTSARLEPALGSNAQRCPRLLTLFERSGIDGPIGVTAQGDLFSTATDNLRKVNHSLPLPIAVISISADGRQVVLGRPGPSPSNTLRAVVDVDTLGVVPTTESMRHRDAPIHAFGNQPTLRNRFFEILVSRSGELTLRSRNQHLAIVDEPSTDRICFKSRNDCGAVGDAHGNFEPFPNNDRGYSLQGARFPDGSRAVLDSRGLLHLASSDKSIPEVTLVLLENEISGWCSDGRMWGREYFIGGVRGANKHDVFQSTIKRFVERLT